MAEVWAKLNTRLPLHRRILRLLEEDAGGETDDVVTPEPSPPPANSSATIVAAPPMPVTLTTAQRQLRAKVFATKVGLQFLIPVIARMTVGRCYRLEELATMGGVSMRKAHASVSVAGRIEKRFGKIFEREAEIGEPMLFKVSADIKQALAA